MPPWWVTLLREQQSDGFPDLAGTAVSAAIPISDQLISRVIAERIPSTAPVREVLLAAHAGNQITIRVRVTKPGFLPPIQMRLAIEQQPVLPGSPILVLGIVSQGLASLAVNALKFVDVLPPGVRVDGRRFIIDLATLLERYGAAEVLTYLTDLKMTTLDGRVVVEARASLPVRRSPDYSDRSM